MRSPFAVMMIAVLAAGACANAAAEPRAKSLNDAVAPPPAETPPPDARAEDLVSLLAMLYPDWPSGFEGKQTMEISIRKNATGAYEARVIQAGLLDDSVVQTKDILTFGKDGAWYVARMEKYRKCYRTGMFEWTTALCP